MNDMASMALVDGRLEDCFNPGVDEEISRWPDHMVAVFRAVGATIIGKQLRPEHLSRLPVDDRSIVPDHCVSVSHISKTETGEKRGRYVVVITGPRIDGKWNLQPGAMDRLSRQATAAIDGRGSSAAGCAEGAKLA